MLKNKDPVIKSSRKEDPCNLQIFLLFGSFSNLFYLIIHFSHSIQICKQYFYSSADPLDNQKIMPNVSNKRTNLSKLKNILERCKDTEKMTKIWQIFPQKHKLTLKHK